MSTFSTTVNLADIDAMFGAIEAGAQAAARPAAQAMAQVLYDDVRANVARLKRRTGNLQRSIYQAYSQDKSDPGRAEYHISWNAKKAPHGHLVEFGHLQRYEITYDAKTKRFTTHKDRPLAAPKQVAARPFLRPALDKAVAARAAGRAEFLRRMGLAP